MLVFVMLSHILSGRIVRCGLFIWKILKQKGREMNETKKKKRSFSIAVMLIIMTFALCITLISCGGSETADNDSEKIKTEQNADVKNDEKDTENKARNDREKAVTESQQAKKSETEKATQKATQKATTEAATQAKKVCYITIEGYCSGKEISLQGGDTVYSILCRSGAAVSGSGHYIKGINGRFEFDEGPSSGWTYYLNGSKPTVGCGSCSVKTGDNIRWDYVTSY